MEDAVHCLEVELAGLHLNDGVRDVCEADAEQDVLGPLGPHATGVGQPVQNRFNSCFNEGTRVQYSTEMTLKTCTEPVQQLFNRACTVKYI